MRGVFLGFCLILLSEANAQVNRYVVYFKDKAGTPYSIAQPEKYLSAQSLSRRAKQNIVVIEEDLPVKPAYIANVKNAGAKTFFSSRWLNCVLVECTPTIVNALKQLSEISSIEYVAPGSKLKGGRIANASNKLSLSQSQAGLVQYQQLGIDQMNASGFNGSGVNIAIFDGGFSGVNTATAFQTAYQQKIRYTYNFVENSSSVYAFNDHGTEVFSIIGAQSTSFTGGVINANYFLFVTEDVSSEYRVEEYNWLFASERADSLGVDIISSSLGYNLFDDASMNYKVSDLNGSTAIISKAASIALKKGMMVVNPSGNNENDGWNYIIFPADVKGILSVGSITSTRTLSSFSLGGPTADGRIKPDVVALGSAASVINSAGSLTTNKGTSFSCPLVTCLVAGVWQAYPSLSAEGVYNAIIRSADQSFSPDNLKGYGVPNFVAIKNYLESTLIEDQIVVSPNPITNGTMKVIFKEPKEGDINVTVYDLQGRILTTTTMKMIWQNNPLEFDLSMIAAGVYIVQVKTQAASLTTRLVKL
jgi:subtilisin family serine protease